MYRQQRNAQAMRDGQNAWDLMPPSDGRAAEDERRFWIKDRDRSNNIALAVKGDADTLRWIANDLGDYDAPVMHEIIGLVLRQDKASDTVAESLLRTMIDAALGRMADAALERVLDDESEADRG